MIVGVVVKRLLMWMMVWVCCEMAGISMGGLLLLCDGLY